MIKITKEFLKEPLLHFLLLGGAFYVYFTLVHKEEEVSTKLIILSSYELQELKNSYKKEYKKEADKKILNILIAKKYYDTVLLDKAFSLKIAQNDRVVTQRLLKKMQFVMQDRSQFKEPTQEELYAYYKKNREDYSHIKKISFSSVYFHNDKDKRIASTFALLTIAKVKSNDAEGFSDSSPLPSMVQNASREEIEKNYGKYFAKKLFRAKSGLWHKAIHTKNGVRIVYIFDKKGTKPYDFDTVESRVYRDYINEELRVLKEKAYEKIVAQYSLKVE